MKTILIFTLIIFFQLLNAQTYVDVKSKEIVLLSMSTKLHFAKNDTIFQLKEQTGRERNFIENKPNKS